jgi:outer membrane protein assembly factor BamD
MSPVPRRALLLALAVLLAGCGATLREQIAPGTASFVSGKAAYDREDWTSAIADLRAYVEQYPGTELTDDALYYLGQAYMEIKDHALASSQFDRLVRDFPTTPFEADALYQLARCDDLQSHPAPLDQTETERAIQRYAQFLERFPGHERAADATARSRALKDRLAEKRFRNGRLYHRLKQYPAAAIYLRATIADYPESRWALEAGILLADVLVHLGHREEAADTLRRLAAGAPEGSLRRRAEERLRELERDGTPR